MVRSFTRRSVLAGGAGLVAAALPFGPAAAEQVKTFSWGVNNPGFTTLVARYIQLKELDKKHGFALAAPANYQNVPTYYNDFVVGAYDLCQMDWNTAATMHLRGVPLKFLCKMTTGNMIGLVAKKGAVKSIEDLRGKVVVGQQSTGAYRMMRALLAKRYKLDVEKDATMQSVTTGSAGINLVRAGQAVAAVTWEPHLTLSVTSDPDLEIVADAGSVYRDVVGRTLPYFGVAVRRELVQRDNTVASRINKLFHDAAQGIMADVGGAVGMMGNDDRYFPPAVLETAIASGRLRFEFGATSDPGPREDVDAAVRFFHENGVVPGLVKPDFYA